MAYREKTFNADTLTDLLNTYLSHKNLEREKYYQAELKRKPTYKAFGDELLKIGPSGDIQGVAMTKAPAKKKPDTYYPIDASSGLDPIMTQDIGGTIHYIKDGKWEVAGADILGKYKTDVPKKTGASRSVSTMYDTDTGKQVTVQKQGGRVYSVVDNKWQELSPNQISKLGEKPKEITNYTSTAKTMIDQSKKLYPDIDLSGIESIVPGVDNKELFTQFKTNLGKRQTQHVSTKKNRAKLEAQQYFASNVKEYNMLGEDVAAVLETNTTIRADFNVRTREKRAIQKLIRPLGKKSGKEVYIKTTYDKEGNILGGEAGDDDTKLRKDFISFMKKNGNPNTEDINTIPIKELWDRIDNYNAKSVRLGNPEMPFYIHRYRLKGYGDAEAFLDALSIDFDLPKDK